ncbi:hypothetical protein [Flexistipes sinusarabici]|nr:hypothetical protein [Flexistipes sinusarabici]
MNKIKNIGSLLLDYKMITEEDLDEALEFQKEKGAKLGQALVQLGKVKQDEIDYILSRQVDEPFIILDDINIDTSLIRKYSSELLINNRILPIYESDESITIVTDDPFNLKAFEKLREITKKSVSLTVSHGEKIERILKSVLSEGNKNKFGIILERLIKDIEGTSFYRLDFYSHSGVLEINIFGFNLLQNYTVLEEKYSQYQIMQALDDMNIHYFYSQYPSENGFLFQIYPLMSESVKIETPAALGKFGLVKTEGAAFSDLDFHGSEMIFRSDSPVKGYLYYSFNLFSHYENAVNIIDNVAEKATDESEEILYTGYLPSKCGSCGGEGCSKCNNFGYRFEKLNDNIKISDISTNFNK